MPDIRVGLIGAGFMGRAHAIAFRSMPLLFEAAAPPCLEIVADSNEAAARALAASFGFRRWTGDWREVAADPNVDVVDITAPNHLHKAMALAAIAAGKHVYCEKPLALTAPDAKAMVEAAEKAGIKTLVGFNYLKNPATGLAKRVIEGGEIGTVVRFRGTFDQDALADPRAPHSWRFERAAAGSGALGDLGSHVVSLAQHLVGDIEEVCGQAQTVINRRPIATAGAGYRATAGRDAETRAVENEDQVQALVRFAGGATGTIESSRIASGRKLWLTYEITGTRGALWFTQERMNEIKLYRTDDPAGERGFRTIFTGPEHPPYDKFYPIAGIGLGFADQKLIEVFDLIDAIVHDRPLQPDFSAGWRTAQVVDAILRSAAERRWVKTDEC